jgi:hypothetical protein
VTLPVEAPGIIRAHYNPLWKEMLYSIRLQLRIKLFRLPIRIGGYFMCLMCLICLTRHEVLPFMSWFCAIMIGFGDWILAFLAVLMGWKKIKDVTYSFEFTPKDYYVQHPGAEARIAWSTMIGIIVTGKGYLIRLDPNLSAWVPFRAFVTADDSAAFLDLVRAAGLNTRKI